MAILKVARLGHPVLREVAASVEPIDIQTPKIQSLIDDMISTMREYNGAGLAAPQVHEPLRVVVFEVKDNPRYPDAPTLPLTVAINPQIDIVDKTRQGNWEGCLSIPGMRGYVERPHSIIFSALDRYGVRFSLSLTGFSATVAQHECDHLDGKLYVDRMENLSTLSFVDEFNRFQGLDK